MNRRIPSVFAKAPALASGLAGLLLLATPGLHASVKFIGDAVITGTGTDQSGLSSTVLEDGVSPHNALNGFGSGLAYAGGSTFYALSDRGPNKVAYTGGVAVDNTTSFEDRFQQFALTFTPVGSPNGSGQYAAYTIGAANTGTTLLKNPQGTQYTGISTGIANGLRFDCEGIRVAPDGTVWISDEYGPFVRHFNRLGLQIGALTLPAGFTIATSDPIGANETSVNTLGRVNNKGMEGLAITPDGKSLVGVMQSPLIQDGGGNGTNVRIVVWDLTNPSATPKQYLYQLDSTATSISEILAVNSHKFLVDERNGSSGAAGIKKLYLFDLKQASAPTDLAATSFNGTTTANGLPTTGTPSGVTPLAKSLFADIGALLTGAGNAFTTDGANFKTDLPDKVEGYAWGPDLVDGRHVLLATNDNDFVQPATTAGGAITGKGYPNYIFAFAVDPADVPDFQPQTFDAQQAANTIDHIIVVYQENWSFDGLYGSFPGANGVASASTASTTQLNRLTGNPIANDGPTSYNIPAFVPSGTSATTAQTTNPPPPLTADSATGVADTRVPSNTNTLQPYFLTSYINPTLLTGDIYHRYWQEQFQIRGTIVDPVHGFSEGQNNSGFVTWSDNPGLTMSRYDATSLPEGLLAQQYTMNDAFYHSAFGGSFLNHQFLVAAAAPVYDNMPTSNNGNIAYVDSNGVFVLNTSGTGNGKYVRDGNITPVAGDQITVTLNGSSTTLTLAQANAQAYVAPSGTYFDKHYAVNTIRSKNLTGNGESPAAASTLPSLNDSNPNDSARTFIPTIGDVLSAANVSWKWYSGGWDLIKAYSGSNPTPTTSPSYSSVNATNQFQYHHQPFAYYDNYAPFDTVNTVPAAYVGGFVGAGTSGLSYGQSGVTRAQNSVGHLQDETNFFTDVANNTLPAVSFIKPVGVNNEHPGYAAVQTGQAHVASIVQAVQANPALWAHTAIIVTYDEHGGRWDHATPPNRDIWGPGVRVPCIVISPLAKKGFVDHTARDTSAVLSTIEQRWNLPALNQRDAGATTFFDVFTLLDVARSGYTVNRRTNIVTQVVTVTNRGSSAVAGPVLLALDNLTSNTSLSNAAGTTANNAPAGSPYVTVSANGLAAGASATVTLQFALPATGSVNYTYRTITGTSVP